MSRVSKRFRALCVNPQLLRQLDVSPATASDASLRSLQKWLAANAQHATSLRLDTRTEANPDLVVRCLETCCGAAPLQQLTVDSAYLPSLSWLLQVRSTLHTLDLDVSCLTRPTIDVLLQRLSLQAPALGSVYAL